MKRLAILLISAAVVMTPQAVAAATTATAVKTTAQTVETAILAAPVTRGQVITPDMLENSTIDVRSARGALAADQIIGMEARRTLAAGSVVRSHDLKEPDLVKKGQAVSMVVTNGALTIVAAGRALDDGSKGKLIRVQNSSSKQIVEGEVATAGVVKISTGGNMMLAGL